MLNNGCNEFLFGVHCVEEGDRIPPLQSYGHALKEKNCFSGVLGYYWYCYYYYYIGQGVTFLPLCVCLSAV